MKGFYINLDRRTDRRAEIEKELEGQNIERFPAVSHECGLVGCALSHIVCLKLAKERGYPEVLIFEDDFMWSGERTIPELPHDQDVCLLAWNTKTLEKLNDSWSRGRDIATTSAQIAKSSMQDALIARFTFSVEKISPLQKLNIHRWWDHALDNTWKVLQTDHKFQCSTPRLGIQRPSQSDTVNKFVTQNV